MQRVEPGAALVDKGTRVGIVVGTWPELMEWACRAYLVPETTGDNDSDFRKALEEVGDAFWTKSLVGSACRNRHRGQIGTDTDCICHRSREQY